MFDTLVWWITWNAAAVAVGIGRRVFGKKQHMLGHPYRVHTFVFHELYRIADKFRGGVLAEGHGDANFHEFPL